MRVLAMRVHPNRACRARTQVARRLRYKQVLVDAHGDRVPPKPRRRRAHHALSLETGGEKSLREVPLHEIDLSTVTDLDELGKFGAALTAMQLQDRLLEIARAHVPSAVAQECGEVEYIAE